MEEKDELIHYLFICRHHSHYDLIGVKSQLWFRVILFAANTTIKHLTYPFARSLQQDVDKFSDVEKLYLYLKLPSGSSSNADKR